MSASATGPLPSRWATRANALSLLRLAAAPALVCAVVGNAPHVALALFALAVATDLLDGPIARRFGEASALGGLLDHGADASFVVAGLGALALQGTLPALLPILVAAAFLQYVLDSRALAGRRLRASGLGRANGVAYFVLLGVPVVRDGLALGWPADGWVSGLGWLLVGSTLLSMGERGWVLLRRSR